MREYEMIHEIPNMCPNNQRRDVFFQEVACDDPVAYTRQLLKAEQIQLSWEERDDGTVTVFAVSDGLDHKFVYTPI